MAKKLETPCAAPKRRLPWELKHDFVLRGYTLIVKGFLYAIREKFGAAAALEIYERVCTMDDRVKNLTNTIRTIFKLTDNNCESIGEVIDIWDELMEIESTILERIKTINRRKVTKCPWKTEPKDISDWALFFYNIIGKTVNPEASLKRLKAMCAGEPHCEYVWKIEE